MHENRVHVQSRAETREALLDATEEALARVGYTQLTMERIAEQAGMARRTVYLYFRGKEEAVLATVDRIVERVLSRMATLGDADAPASARLQRMLVARVVVRCESVQGYYQALDGLFASLRARLLARRREHFAREAELLARVMRAGQRMGELADGNPRKAADLLILCTNALLPHGLSGEELSNRARLERRAAAAAALLLEGLRRRPAPKPTQRRGS